MERGASTKRTKIWDGRGYSVCRSTMQRPRLPSTRRGVHGVPHNPLSVCIRRAANHRECGLDQHKFLALRRINATPAIKQSTDSGPPLSLLPRYWGSSPSSLSSYSTRNPETVSEAETQETTKLLAVISVTDSEVVTTEGSAVVSPETRLAVVKAKRKDTK